MTRRLIAAGEGRLFEFDRMRVRAVDLVAELPAPWRSSSTPAPPVPQPAEVAGPTLARNTRRPGGGRKPKVLSPGVAEAVRRWSDPRTRAAYTDLKSLVSAVREDVDGARGITVEECRKAIEAAQRRDSRRSGTGGVDDARSDRAA